MADRWARLLPSQSQETRGAEGDSILMVVAPFLSPSAKDRLAEAGISFATDKFSWGVSDRWTSCLNSEQQNGDHPRRNSTRFQGEATVGKLVVTIGVGDQQGRQFEDLEVTVDTGSTFTAVPRTLLQRLGVPVRRSARSRLADGSTVPVDIGWTVVRLEDQIFATQVTFAEENQPSLLGVVTLEDALLAVDPVGQRLVPVEAERL